MFLRPKLLGSYASVVDLYTMGVREEIVRLRLEWAPIKERRAWRDVHEGAQPRRHWKEARGSCTFGRRRPESGSSHDPFLPAPKFWHSAREN